MRRAIAAAEEVRGSTSPNPPVGCVVLDAGGEQVGVGATEPPPGWHAEVERSAVAAAGHELAGLVAELAAAGHRVRGVAVAVGTTRVPQELATILGSHPLLHAAEGELYREALADAAEAAGLPVVRFVGRNVLVDAAAALERPIADTLAELGRGLGPPWAKDQKEAAAAALLALGMAA